MLIEGRHRIYRGGTYTYRGHEERGRPHIGVKISLRINGHVFNASGGNETGLSVT